MLQEFARQVEQTARDVVDEIHTALPAKVISFDPMKGTAEVKPCGSYGMSDGTCVEYPIITEVPVVFPFSQTAGVGIGFPVRSGDSCLVVMSEVELDEWRSGAAAGGALRFDLSSAIAIPGLLSSGAGLAARACSLNAVVVSAGEAEVAVSGSGVSISGNVTINGSLNVNGNIGCVGSGPWEGD